MASRPANILIVDDDPAIRQILRRALVRLFAATVLEADDGLTALERLAHEPVDVIMLDVAMRFMNGVETLEAVRRSPAYARIPVVMLTSATDEAQVLRILKLNVSDFLVKPFTLDGIQTRVGPVIATALARTSSGPKAQGDTAGLPWQLGAASHVLIVDGSSEFRRAFAEPFKLICRVDEAESSIIALRHCFANPPDAVFLGNTASALLDDAAFAAKLRATPDLRGIQLFRIASVDQVAAARAAGLYDGVVDRSVECGSLLASLEQHLDPASTARLLLSPTSPCVQAMGLSVHALLQKTLGTEVHLQLASGVVMPSDKRWVSAVLELRSEQQLWRLTMVWTHACALLAASVRLALSSDLVSETQIGMVASDLLVRIAEGLQRAVFERGTECSLGKPSARFASARNADVDTLATARGTQWYSANGGACGALLQLAPQ